MHVRAGYELCKGGVKGLHVHAMANDYAWTYAPINANPHPPPPGHGWGFATEGVKKMLPGGQIFWQITLV